MRSTPAASCGVPSRTMPSGAIVTTVPREMGSGPTTGESGAPEMARVGAAFDGGHGVWFSLSRGPVATCTAIVAARASADMIQGHLLVSDARTFTRAAVEWRNVVRSRIAETRKARA